MVIAIDEVGDFAPTSQRYNFMVAVLIPRHNNGIATKEAQFQNWKNSIDRSKFTNQNEVKGTDLTEDELFRFTNQVILSEPVIASIQIRIKPFETSIKVFDRFKEIEKSLIELMIGHYEGLDDKEGMEFYGKLLRWFTHRNFQHYMKIVLLENCIGRSVQMAMGMSIVYWALKDDTDIMNIEIKMDKDFVKKSGEKKYFKELLRQAFRRITEDHPIPMARELLGSKHPFVRKYMLSNGMINLSEMFDNRCDFEDSHRHFELQIADILGTIIHRAHNRNTCLNSANLINQRLGQNGQVKTHLLLNQNPDTNVGIRFDQSDG